MSAVDIGFTYDRAEYERAVRWRLFRTRALRRFDPAVCVLAIGASVLVIVDGGYLAAGIVLCVVAALVLALWLTIYFYVPGRNFKRDPRHFHPYTFSFSEESIRFTALGAENSDLPWATYRALEENRECFFLLYGSNAYVVLPKRAFLAGDADAFRRMATDAIARAAKASRDAAPGKEKKAPPDAKKDS